jgi:two-component system, NtrC family, response regulator HydG
MERLPGCRVLIDEHYRIVAANAAYRLHCASGTEQEIVGQHCYEASHGYATPCERMGESCPRMATDRSGMIERTLHVHHTPCGARHVSIELIPIAGGDGGTRYYMEHFEPLRGESDSGRCIGRDPSFLRVLELLKRVAGSETSVLLLGETGTGKEVLARSVHELSPRAGRPFVVVDCAGLAESLFESELFGHERGAFTGAVTRKPGLVEAAAGGTLFIDEVGDIPLSLQVKLLRLLETGVFRHVGGNDVQHADFRLVAATHRDLATMVEDGRFRRDLFYRISAFPIQVPPLRERRDDIPLLAYVMLERLRREEPRQISAAALECLGRYPFPGNVRELRNIVERAALLAEGDVIDVRHIPQPVRDAVGWDPEPGSRTPRLPALQEAERVALRREVLNHRGSRRELAERLGLSERTLYRRLRALGAA